MEFPFLFFEKSVLTQVDESVINFTAKKEVSLVVTMNVKTSITNLQFSPFSTVSASCM